MLRTIVCSYCRCVVFTNRFCSIWSGRCRWVDSNRWRREDNLIAIVPRSEWSQTRDLSERYAAKAILPHHHDRESTHLESVNPLAILVQVVHQMHLDGYIFFKAMKCSTGGRRGGVIGFFGFGPKVTTDRPPRSLFSPLAIMYYFYCLSLFLYYLVVAAKIAAAATATATPHCCTLSSSHPSPASRIWLTEGLWHFVTRQRRSSHNK